MHQHIKPAVAGWIRPPSCFALPSSVAVAAYSGDDGKVCNPHKEPDFLLNSVGLYCSDHSHKAEYHLDIILAHLLEKCNR